MITAHKTKREKKKVQMNSALKKVLSKEQVRQRVGPEDSNEVELVVEEDSHRWEDMDKPLFNGDFIFWDFQDVRGVLDEDS